MTDFYRTPDEITADMLADLKTVTGQTLQPTDLGRDEVIKIRQSAVMFSQMSAELQRAHDDFFPQSASTEGLIKHLAARQLPDRAAASKCSGVVTFTGTIAGTPIPIGTRFKRLLNGKLYETTAAVVLGAGLSVTAGASSVDTGQDTNIEVENGEEFELVETIVGISATVLSAVQFRDGRDIETPAEMLARIEIHDRRKDSGGNLAAYERWAREASSQVVKATALDEPRGPGTVDTVITSGTTDIEAAVENGDPITRLPSATLIAAVQAYIIEKKPVTDNHQTVAPVELNFDATVTYDLYDESLRDAVDVEIDKAAKIYIYGAVPQQRLEPTELERAIDTRVGHLIRARRVSNFGGANTYYVVPDGNILVPGVITKGPFP